MRNPDDFKIGFLRSMARMGLTPSDFEHGLEKSGIVSELVNSGVSVAKMLTLAGIGIPLAGGFAAGGIARAATHADDEDVEEVKAREMANLYRQLAQEARLRAKRGQR